MCYFWGRLEEGIFWSVPRLPGRKRPAGDLHLLLQGQAQECLLEKSMLDNRKSFLVARISAQVGRGPRMSGLLCPGSPIMNSSQLLGGGLL